MIDPAEASSGVIGEALEVWARAYGYWNEHNGADVLLIHPWSVRVARGNVEIYTSKHARSERIIEGWTVADAAAMLWALCIEVDHEMALLVLDATPIDEVEPDIDDRPWAWRRWYEGREDRRSAFDALAVEADRRQADGDDLGEFLALGLQRWFHGHYEGTKAAVDRLWEGAVLAVLREAGLPMYCFEVANMLMAPVGIGIYAVVDAVLRLVSRGAIVSDGGPSLERYSLARPSG